MFNTLCAHDIYNEILKFTVDLLMLHDINLRVVHIPGEANIVADYLSRGQIALAQATRPVLQLFSFQPPAELVEAVTP